MEPSTLYIDLPRIVYEILFFFHLLFLLYNDILLNAEDIYPATELYRKLLVP